MPKTLTTRPNLHNNKIVKTEIPPNKDKLKEFKDKLLSGSVFLKIY